MTNLVEQFLEEVANGHVPREESPEAQAYAEWAGSDQKVSGTWAEWKLLEIESKVRMDQD